MSPDHPLFLHNPRCSKSKRVKELLDERGIQYSERHYLEQPLSESELAELGSSLGAPPLEWTRTTQAEFQNAGLSHDSTPGEVYAALAKHPILMQRPIVVKGERAIIGRPPEAVLDLF